MAVKTKARRKTSSKRKVVAQRPRGKAAPQKPNKKVVKKKVTKTAVKKVSKARPVKKPAFKKRAAKKRGLSKPGSNKAGTNKVVAKKTTTTAAQPVVLTKAAPKSVLLKLVEAALADMKAVNVTVLDVRGLTDVADNMVIACGNSDRHVRSIAENVVQEAKKAGFRPMGMEGERDGEWALVDLQDIIVHVMLPRVREFYRLESLWDISAARREAALPQA